MCVVSDKFLVVNHMLPQSANPLKFSVTLVADVWALQNTLPCLWSIDKGLDNFLGPLTRRG